MRELPKQFRTSVYRFLIIPNRQKRPIEKWSNKEFHLKHDNKNLLEHLKSDGNIGIISGYSGLVVIDCDKPELTEHLKFKLPPTLNEKSSKGKHFFYICKDFDKFISLDIGNEHYGEVRGDKKHQTVMSPSVHETGIQYEIIDDIDIAEITSEQIMDAIYPFIEKKIQWERHNTESKELPSLDITKVIDISQFGQNGMEYQGAHPIHGSTTGLNFCVNTGKNLWHCFRHNCGGNALHLVAVLEGIIDCGDKLEDEKFKKTLEILQSKYGLKVPIEENVEKIHLMDIEKSEHLNKKVECEVSVRGVGQVYKVPCIIEAIWLERGEDGESVRRGKTVILPNKSDLFIKMTSVPVEKQYTNLKNYIINIYGLDENTKIKLNFLQHQTVTEIIIFPIIKELKMNKETGKVIDEGGREYRKIFAYYLGEKDSKEVQFNASGYVIKNPKNSTVTFLIDNLKPMESGINNFDISTEFKVSVSILQPNNNPAKIKINWIVNQLRNIVRLKGRDFGIIADLLFLHSPQWIEFDGELIKGWIECAKVGDTTTGKSQGSKLLKDYIDLGTMITGETASRTGLLYAIDTSYKGHILTWGLMPLNDKGALIVDGANYVSKNEWGEARETRRSGILKVYRSVSGETYCRVRLMLIFNPTDWKGDTFSLSSSLFPVSTLKMIQQHPDIARLDFALFYKIDDVSGVQGREEWRECGIPSKVLRDNILWVWSRQIDQIIFEEETINYIHKEAEKIVIKYGNEDIPLVSNDMRFKIARLSCAVAGIVHSTDENHEKIIVKKEHVDFVIDFLNSIYSTSNCSLDLYSQIKRGENTLSEEDFKNILQKLLETKDEDRSNINEALLELFLKNDTLRLDEVVNSLGVGEKAIISRISVLKGKQLISSGKDGYKKRPKFVLFLKKIMNRDGSIDLSRWEGYVCKDNNPEVYPKNLLGFSGQNKESVNTLGIPSSSGVNGDNFPTNLEYNFKDNNSNISGYDNLNDLNGLDIVKSSIDTPDKLFTPEEKTSINTVLKVIQSLQDKNKSASETLILDVFDTPDHEKVIQILQKLEKDGKTFAVRPTEWRLV